jgi:hypothetical protein
MTIDKEILPSTPACFIEAFLSHISEVSQHKEREVRESLEKKNYIP